jgi:hypothetical protein
MGQNYTILYHFGESITGKYTPLNQKVAGDLKRTGLKRARMQSRRITIIIDKIQERVQKSKIYSPQFTDVRFSEALQQVYLLNGTF